MKTLINKANPAIRITAPEIESYRESDREFYVLPNADFHRLFKMENWTLVEEESVDLEKEIDKTISECTNGYNFDWNKFARHFYNLGRNSLEFLEKYKEKI